MNFPPKLGEFVLRSTRLVFQLIFSCFCSVTQAGGAFGAITAFVAYYVGLSELLASEDMTVVNLPIGVFVNTKRRD